MGRARLTNEEIDRRIQGRSIVRVSDYPGKQTVKILWKCIVDGHEWEATTQNVVNGKGCPKCSGNIPLNNKTIDDGLCGRDIERLSDYQGKNNKKMKWRCIKDGYEWYATANDIRSGKGCPLCAGNLPLSNDDIDKRLIGRDIKRIGNYVSYHEKIEWECLKDGHRWYQSPSYVLRGSNPTGCPLCAGNTKQDSTKVDVILRDCDVFRIGEYINNSTPILLKCKDCGNQFNRYMYQITKSLKKQKHICPNCLADNNKDSYYKKAKQKLERSGITFHGDYKGMNYDYVFSDSYDNIWQDTMTNVLTKYNLKDGVDYNKAFRVDSEKGISK